MEVRFWGVRGSVASSGAHVARIGGNTSCVEVESQGHRLILDAGTGLRSLGEALATTWSGSPVLATEGGSIVLSGSATLAGWG